MNVEAVSYFAEQLVGWKKTDCGMRLFKLFDLSFNVKEEFVPPACRDSFVVRTAHGILDSRQWHLVKSSVSEDSAIFIWSTDNSLIFESHWKLCKKTGIIKRSDVIINDSEDLVQLTSCRSRFAFSPEKYEYFSQSCSWCNESQGTWQEINTGSVCLGCEGGRTTQGTAPFICVREKQSGLGAAFHVLPRGNWSIRLATYTNVAGGWISSKVAPYLTIDIGMADDDFNLVLEGRKRFELPEILITPLPEGRQELAAPILHRYLLDHQYVDAKDAVPVVYNTWFDLFEIIDFDRLKEQLCAAKKIGCEVFCVDAGWYGNGEGQWGQQVGNWHDKTNGRLAEFAAEVRNAGLRFGLWMEPERYSAGTAIVREHPDWFCQGFLPGQDIYFYPDLSNSGAKDYVISEMARLIEEYGLGWMKVDFNFGLINDPTHSELACYYGEWYSILSELRNRYPDVIFEGCASGGLRCDINSVQQFDCHFLSDNANPFDTLRIYEQSILRLLPGRLMKWMVLRSVGKTIPEYGKSLVDSTIQCVTPAGSGATWQSSETVDPEFAALVVMVGMFGISGDLAGLEAKTIEKLSKYVEFYKHWRRFIAVSVAHLLTPPTYKSDRTGWSAIQLQNETGNKNLLFVYRLDDYSDQCNFQLRRLDKNMMYRISQQLPVSKTPILELSGEHLMTKGLSVCLPNRFSAAVFTMLSSIRVVHTHTKP